MRRYAHICLAAILVVSLVQTPLVHMKELPPAARTLRPGRFISRAELDAITARSRFVPYDLSRIQGLKIASDYTLTDARPLPASMLEEITLPPGVDATLEAVYDDSGTISFVRVVFIALTNVWDCPQIKLSVRIYTTDGVDATGIEVESVWYPLDYYSLVDVWINEVIREFDCSSSPDDRICAECMKREADLIRSRARAKTVVVGAATVGGVVACSTITLLIGSILCAAAAGAIAGATLADIEAEKQQALNNLPATCSAQTGKNCTPKPPL